MAVFRVEKNSGYTVMSNHHLRNQELSLKAKGLLSQMLSLPDNWDYTLKGLSLINREKIDAIREAIRELERAGYIVRSRERDEKGRLRGADYVIYELPQKPVSDLPTLENPTLENPTLEKPTLENPTQLNKDILRTDLSKKEKSITDLSSTDSIPILSPYPSPLSVDGEQAAAPPERKRKETADSENEAYHEYYANDESWQNYVLHNQGAESWEQDKAEREMILSEFVPYMRLHCNLSEQERTAADVLENGENLTPEQTAYFTAVLAHVDTCREKLNAGDYHLPDPPQLYDFAQETAEMEAYKDHVREEIAQEAAAAGMGNEEYAANGYGYHHSSEDGKYLIMGNGTQAYAIAAEQRVPENYMRTAELTTEQNYNMIDGRINNTPSVDELEEKAKRGEVISLSALAAAVKTEDGRTPQRSADGKKPSIRAQLKADREQAAAKPKQKEKGQEARRSVRQALEME